MNALHKGVNPPTPRHFGMVMGAVATVVAVVAQWRGHGVERNVAIALAITLLSLSMVRPQWLAPLSRAWMALGTAMGRVVQPIVLGIIYFVLITPVALIGRMAGRDTLHLRRVKTASHWTPRSTHVWDANAFKHPY